MTKIEAICLFLGITKKTWYNWKDEERPITKFIELYLRDNEIEEFLKKGKVNILEDKIVKHEVFLKKYESYINPLLSISALEFNDLFHENDFKNIESTLFINIPILTFFEYLFCKSEEGYNKFGYSIFQILKNYSYSETQYMPEIHELFKVDEQLIQIFDILSYHQLSIYYDYSGPYSDINLHAYFNLLFLKIKRIQKLIQNKEKRNEQIFELIKTFSYDEKYNYSLDIRVKLWETDGYLLNEEIKN